MADLTQFVPKAAEELVKFAPKEGLGLLWTLVTVWILIIVSSLPLYISLKLFFAKKASILRVFLVNLIVGFLVAVIKYYFAILGGIIAFVLLLFIYKIAFGIGWIRAILVWLLQFVILAALAFALALIGINLL